MCVYVQNYELTLHVATLIPNERINPFFLKNTYFFCAIQEKRQKDAP